MKSVRQYSAGYQSSVSTRGNTRIFILRVDFIELLIDCQLAKMQYLSLLNVRVREKSTGTS